MTHGCHRFSAFNFLRNGKKTGNTERGKSLREELVESLPEVKRLGSALFLPTLEKSSAGKRWYQCMNSALFTAYCSRKYPLPRCEYEDEIHHKQIAPTPPGNSSDSFLLSFCLGRGALYSHSRICPLKDTLP